MEYPFLRPIQIEQASDDLLLQVFGDENRIPVDLEAVLYDHLAELEGLIFNDEVPLGHENGDRILGRMKPFLGRIDVCSSLRQPYATGRRKGRYRFTVCHEIGHWVLHRPLFLSADVPDIHARQRAMVSLQRNVFGTGPDVPREEWQANRFAAYMLMPNTLLLRAFVGRFGEPPVLTDSNRSISDTAMELAIRSTRGIGSSLSDTFEVSRQAMAIALESRGYVTDQPKLL